MSAHRRIRGIQALRDSIIVAEMNFAERQLSSGIVLLSDDGKTDGVRPRWARVISVGPDQRDITAGQWVMVEHGRWTRGSKIQLDGEDIVIRKIDPLGVMLVSDHEPAHDDTISDAVHFSKLER